MILIELTKAELQEAINVAVANALSSQIASPPDDLLSRRDAAKYLQITLPTLRAWEEKGHIKAIRFGNRVFFSKSELLKPKK